MHMYMQVDVDKMTSMKRTVHSKHRALYDKLVATKGECHITVKRDKVYQCALIHIYVMCVRSSVWVYFHMYAHVFVHMNAYAYAQFYVGFFICMCVFVCVILYGYIHMYVFVYIYAYASFCVGIFVCVCGAAHGALNNIKQL